MTRVLAQITNPVLPASLGSGQPGTAIGSLITNIIDGMFIFAFLLALFFLLTGGIQWITSGGDKTAMEAARNKITHAIVGLIIVAAAFAIMVLVGQFFGLDFKNLPIPAIDQGTSGPIRTVGGGR